MSATERPRRVEPALHQQIASIRAFVATDLSQRVGKPLQPGSLAEEPVADNQRRLTFTLSRNIWEGGHLKFYAYPGATEVTWTAQASRFVKARHTDGPPLEIHELVGTITTYYRDTIAPLASHQSALDVPFCQIEGRSVVIPGIETDLVLTPNYGRTDKTLHGTAQLRPHLHTPASE